MTARIEVDPERRWTPGDGACDARQSVKVSRVSRAELGLAAHHVRKAAGELRWSPLAVDATAESVP